MAHDDAVADPDREELERGAARHPDARLDRLGDLVQMEMAGDDLVGGVGDADHRPFDLPIRQPQGLEQGAVRGPFQPFFHLVGTHNPPPSSLKDLPPGGSPFRAFLFIQRREKTHAGIRQRDPGIGHGNGVFIADGHAGLAAHALPCPSDGDALPFFIRNMPTVQASRHSSQPLHFSLSTFTLKAMGVVKLLS